ncbi:Hypothetical predicted protein [Podarcis lilfordi]|uniref:Uncharacterized protein n=1 Tax=Podarcis lilfordi TaxID=74358 RepID=A0AA35LBQ0_9SAUR|nr:Hypothetical predicted protein [Podarcis lilfordi]
MPCACGRDWFDQAVGMPLPTAARIRGQMEMPLQSRQEGIQPKSRSTILTPDTAGLHTHVSSNTTGLSLVYLKERLQPHRSARTLRSSTEGLLPVPSLREAKLLGTRQRAFSVVAPALWNALQSEVKENKNYQTFRRDLKAAPFREAFNV